MGRAEQGRSTTGWTVFLGPRSGPHPASYFLKQDAKITCRTTVRYLNYGGIGVVMGHEITHGFDDRGSQYDGTGMVSDWWTEEDRANFDERAQCFIDQYSEYEVENVESGDNHV